MAQNLLEIGPFGPGVTCPQVNPSTSPRHGPSWNRPAGNVMPSPVAPQYLPVSGNRNTRKQKEPDKFEGDKVEWADFIAHFDMVARWNDWTYTEKGLQLATCLQGKAQKVLSSIPESQRSDYEAMKSALKRDSAPLTAKMRFVPSFANGNEKVKSPSWTMVVT